MPGFLHLCKARFSDVDSLGLLLDDRDFVFWLPRRGCEPPFTAGFVRHKFVPALPALARHRSSSAAAPFFFLFDGQRPRIGVFCFYDHDSFLCPEQVAASNLLLRCFAEPTVVEVHLDVPERFVSEVALALESWRARTVTAHLLIA